MGQICIMANAIGWDYNKKSRNGKIAVTKNMTRKDIEIMAPVGCMESLHAAIGAGADAIYFGVGVLNMRAKSAVNFTLDDLATIVQIAHAAGVKTYLTVNTILYDNEMDAVREVIDRAVKEGIDDP